MTGWTDLSGYGHDAEVITFPPGIARTAEPPDRSPRLTEAAISSEAPTLLTFDGSDDLIGIADFEPINLGGPYDERTIFLAFRTGDDVQRRQMLFETGGDLRGFNVYLYEGRLYLGAFNVWNDDRGRTTPFGPAHVTASVAPRTPYVATLQFDHPGGALTGYLNGVESGRTEEIGRVFVHHEDTGIGAINEDTYYHDGQRQAVPAADHFGGGIGAILVYNSVLSGADRASTETWLMSRFGIAAAGASAEDSQLPALYVASGLNDLVLRFDPATGAPRGRVPLDRRPTEIDEAHAVALSPTGEHWYATLAHGDPTLWKFELPGDRLVGRLSLGTAGAARIGFTEDGEKAFVPDYDRSRGSIGEVAVIDLQDLQVLASPKTCAGPHHAAVQPGGRLVAVACSLSDEITFLDAESHTVVRRFSVDAHPGPLGEPRFKPLNLAWSPDGQVLYTSLHLAAEIRAFAPDGTRLGSVTVGAGPAQIVLTPSGDVLVSANRGDASLSVVSADVTGSGMQEMARIDLGTEHPHGLTLDDTGRTAYVVSEGTTETQGRVVAVDLRTGRLLWDAPAGGYALGAMYVGG